MWEKKPNKQLLLGEPNLEADAQACPNCDIPVPSPGLFYPLTTRKHFRPTVL